MSKDFAFVLFGVVLGWVSLAYLLQSVPPVRVEDKLTDKQDQMIKAVLFVGCWLAIGAMVLLGAKYGV